MNSNIPSYSTIVKSAQKTVELKDASTEICDELLKMQAEFEKASDKKTPSKQSTTSSSTSVPAKNNSPAKSNSPKKAKPKNTNNKSPKQTDTRQKNANRVSVPRGPKDSLKLQK